MTFIILTNTDLWDDPPRARHQVAEALSRLHKVFFVSTNRFGLPSLKKMPVHANLEVFVPRYPVDFRVRYRIPFLNLPYQKWLFSLLCKEIGGSDVVVINFDNTATAVFEYFKDVIYYCNDYNIRFYYLDTIKRYFEKCEEFLATHSKFCVGTSGFLVERLRRHNTNVIELRLGAAVVQGPLSFRRSKTIRVALVGNLDRRRVSTEILAGLLSRPNVELRLFGMLDKKMRRFLKGYHNASVRGVVKGPALINELKEVDVGIAPYRIEDVNPGGTPNKLWQYLAVGKPVVVSDLPAMREWQFADKFVYRATNAAEFIQAVFRAYEEDTEELMSARAAFATSNSWDRRIDTLLAAVDRYCTPGWQRPASSDDQGGGLCEETTCTTNPNQGVE